ncbi:VOC family protein [Mesorhizobium sp. CU2]|uniref:VOC family protein n=1 Tax=unclassified Mesorhizobium TaxID=325217 RepID=UPI001126C41C|nr:MULTISPECIES: VOC family protein [unclassified Mesorhizobium]TPN81135.1 VOC family protein [Mesorhizobium sp. CU3]TPO17066.1 VOC family protein [Mesorhizobium sp. CU2]
MSRTLLGTADQLGFMVDDLEAAVRSWGARAGIGPFFYFDPAPYEIEYLGKESAPLWSAAIAYAGTTQIELMCQHDDAPSVYQDFKKKHGEGLLHTGRYVPSPKAVSDALVSRGCKMLQFNWDGNKVEDCIYLETADHPGALVELIIATPARLARAELLQKLARDWDGTNPFRPFAELSNMT